MAKYVYLMNGQDSETRGLVARLTPGGFSPVGLVGGQKQLNRVHRSDQLSILAHGTAEANIMVKEGTPRRWSAAAVADQLVQDGLSTKHNLIELLVCEAASATNTVKHATALEKLRLKLTPKYVSAPTPTAKQKIEKQLIGAQDKHAPLVTDMSKWTTKYLLPFGASLAGELKKRSFTHLRVVCYKYCIAQDFTSGKVWLMDPSSKFNREATESDKVVWL